MKNFLLCLLLVLFSCPAFAGTLERPSYIEGEVLVLMNAPVFSDYDDMSAYSQAVSQQTEAFAKEFDLELMQIIGLETSITTGKITLLLYSEHKSTEELIRELSSNPNVISVQPNYIRQTNDPWGCNTGYGSILFLLAGLISLAINKK